MYAAVSDWLSSSQKGRYRSKFRYIFVRPDYQGSWPNGTSILISHARANAISCVVFSSPSIYWQIVKFVLEGMTTLWVAVHKRNVWLVNWTTRDGWEFWKHVIRSKHWLLVSWIFEFSFNAAFSQAALVLKAAWYSLSPTWRYIFIRSFMGAPGRVRRERHLRLFKRCGLPQFLRLVMAIQIFSEWFVYPQFLQDGALEQFLVGWSPLYRLQDSRGCFFLMGLTIPDSSNTVSPARGALEKKAIWVRWGASAWFLPYSYKWADRWEQIRSVSSASIELLLHFLAPCEWIMYSLDNYWQLVGSRF